MGGCEVLLELGYELVRSDSVGLTSWLVSGKAVNCVGLMLGSNSEPCSTEWLLKSVGCGIKSRGYCRGVLWGFLFFRFLFLERRVGNVDWLPLARPQLGTWLATQASALTGNQTGDPWVHRLVLSHTSQSKIVSTIFIW